jgi:hypothetical protein
VQPNRSAELKNQAFVPEPTDRMDSPPAQTLDKTGGNSRVAILTTLSEAEFVDINSFRCSDPVDNFRNKELIPINGKLTKMAQ